MDIDKNENSTPVSGEDVLLASQQEAALLQEWASTLLFGRRRAEPWIALYPDVSHISDYGLERED